MKDFQFLIYKSSEEDVSVNAIIKDESIWLTQKAMAELFGVNPQAITKHLNNIYNEGELKKESTCSKMEQVQNEKGYGSKLLVFAMKKCDKKSLLWILETNTKAENFYKKFGFNRTGKSLDIGKGLKQIELCC